MVDIVAFIGCVVVGLSLLFAMFVSTAWLWVAIVTLVAGTVIAMKCEEQEQSKE